MSKSEHGASGDQADLIVSGSVGALRDLADPPPLSDAQLRIVHWYDQLVRRLSGPRTGDDRGPAKQPPWVKQGPRIESIKVVREEDGSPACLVEGSGFLGTTDVLVDGRSVKGWRAPSPSRLLIPLAGEPSDGAEVEIRTPDGGVAARVDLPPAADIE
ncbi:MAG: hypothetical protein QOF83_7 [Solirubrobacteraceae bacterium]|jgi:hypothetical protein|nr:hypothetical protein [Solirubrobacteraceae bacterium]